MSCPDCGGTRAVLDHFTGGFAPCPSCAIEATSTLVALDDLDEDIE